MELEGRGQIIWGVLVALARHMLGILFKQRAVIRMPHGDQLHRLQVLDDGCPHPMTV